MAPGFGFSVGDFISAIELCTDVIKILKEPKSKNVPGSQALILELSALQKVLSKVYSLESESSAGDLVTAVRGIALTFQVPLQQFLGTCNQYERPEFMKISGTGIEDGLRFRATSNRTEELQKLRAVIAAKTISINLLMQPHTRERALGPKYIDSHQKESDQGNTSLSTGVDIRLGFGNLNTTFPRVQRYSVAVYNSTNVRSTPEISTPSEQQTRSNSSPAADSTTATPKTRGCYIIIATFAAFVTLSCFLGVYFTVQNEYGYSMGDSFTLAGYVVAVGAFVSTAFLAYHYPRCTCWRRSRTADTSDEGTRMVDVETSVTAD